MTRLRRRTAIQLGASVVAATALRLDTGVAAAAASDDGTVLNGVIVSIQSSGSIVLQTRSGQRRVDFKPGATFNRSGSARLADFRIGDRVVVELADVGGQASVGSRLEVSYGRLAGSVIAVDVKDVTTTAGRVAVNADTIVHDAEDFTRQMPLSALREGMAVVITTQFEPSSKTYLARRIGVTSA